MKNNLKQSVLNLNIATVRIQNNQLIINGSNLQTVTTVKLVEGGFTQTFAVESATSGEVIANGVSAITIGVGKVFDMILSNANAAATFPVSFSLNDGSVTAVKLSNMGALSGQVLKFNGTNWAPASLIDAQLFKGTWDPSTVLPDVGLSSPGDYWVISAAGTNAGDGITYAVGDWIISDGYSWSKLALSKTSVTSFNGRKGLVNLVPGDYPNLKSGAKIPGSNLNDLANVDLTTVAPLTNDVLKWNGTNWIPGTGGVGAVGSTEITDLAITGADIAENTINLSKLYSPSIDSALYLRGDKTWANFTAEVLNAPLSTYVLDATTKPTVGVTDKIGPALGKIQKFLNDLNTDYISKTATSQSVSGSFSFTSPTSFLYTQLPSGASPTEVSNVQYVHNYVGAAVSGLSSTAPATLTTANGAAAAGDTTLTVVSTSGYPTAGTLLVGNEAIIYTGTTATTFTGLTRGAYGTTAAAISNGATINNYLLVSKSTSTTTPKVIVTGSGSLGAGVIAPSYGVDFRKQMLIANPSLLQDNNPFTPVEHSTGNGYSGLLNIIGAGGDTVAPIHIGVAQPWSDSAGNPNYYAIITQRQNDNGYWANGARGALANGDYLPGLAFAGQTGTSADGEMKIGAAILGRVDNTVTVGNLPTALVFRTSTTNSTGLTEKLRISSTGNVGIGTTNPSQLLTIGSTSGAQFTASSAGNISASSATIGGASSINVTCTGCTPAVAGTYTYSGQANGYNYYYSATSNYYISWRPAYNYWIFSTTVGVVSASGWLQNGSSTPPFNSTWTSYGTTTGVPTTSSGGLANLSVDGTGNMTTGGTLNVTSTGSSSFTGNVGIGTSTPLEKLEVDGAIKIGSTSNTNAGTIRWDGFNFQGYNGSAWSNFVPTPPASSSCDTTVTFSLAGAYTYTVPASFGTITITMWGAGGSGGWSSNSLGGSGLNGESSSITSLGLFAGGGSGGGFSGGGTLSSPGNGGLATGGTTNSNGGNGGATSTSSGGAGGNAPNGGNGGSLAAIFSTGNNGVSPGGGGSGISSGNNGNNSGGGGSGSYTIKIFNSALITPGSTISDIIVGAGGAPVVNGGQLSGRGAPGRVSITCATSGSVATNDRGLIFWDSGAHTSDSNLVYTSSGYLGIGLPNPTYQLQLSTDSAAKPGTSTWTIASDERLKNIRAPFIRGLKDLLEVDTYYFTYKEDNLLGLPSNKEYVGIKAQQVLKVIPEAISKDKKGFFHVTNDSIIWTAINSIKELYYQLMGVDSKVKKLEAENIKLKLQVEKIEKDKTEIKAYLCLKDPAAPICK